MKLLVGSMLLIAGCASTVRIKDHYLWSYNVEPDHSITINVNGTQIIEYDEKEKNTKYQEQAGIFATNAAHKVCPDGFTVNRSNPIDYQYEDCSRYLRMSEIYEINAGKVAPPSSCTFPVYRLNINCTQNSNVEAPTSTRQETVVLGSADPYDIRTKLMGVMPLFRGCYNAELEKGFQGKAVVHLYFVIKPDGKVNKASVKSESYLPSDILKCVVSVVKGITFTKPINGDDVEVKQPMNFFFKKNK